MSPLPSVTFRSELQSVVRKELDQHDGELSEYLLTEHDDDGRHNNVTAKSITVDGPVTIVGGPVTIDGVPIAGGSAPPAHAPSHSLGGTDPVIVTNLAGYPGNPAVFLRGDHTFQPIPASAPAAHAPTHGAGGSDPVVVTALGGYPGGTTAFLRSDATFQPLPATAPAAHHVSHEPGGADPLSNVAWTNLSNTFTQQNMFNPGVYEKSRGTPMGNWISMAFSAANYVGSGGMTWTVTAGNISVHYYAFVGQTLTLTVILGGTTLSGTPANRVGVSVPPGVTFLAASQSIGQVFPGTAWEPAILTHGGGQFIDIYRMNQSNFPLGTFSVAFQMVLPIV